MQWGWQTACLLLMLFPSIPFFGMIGENFPDISGNSDSDNAISQDKKISNSLHRNSHTINDEVILLQSNNLHNNNSSSNSNNRIRNNSLDVISLSSHDDDEEEDEKGVKEISNENTTLLLSELCKKTWFMMSLIAIFCAGSTELGLCQWLPDYCESVLGYPRWVGSFSLTLFSVLMALGRISASYSKMSGYDILLYSAVTTFVLLLFGCFLPISSLALIACILNGFTGSGK